MQKGSNTPPRKKPGRASLPLIIAPPRDSPFAGISGTKAPAKNTKIPHLTEHVQVAKSRVQALQNAGLHTEAEREATAAAQQILAKSKPLASAFPTHKDGGKPAPRPADKLPARLSQPAVSLAPTRQSAPTPTSSRLPNGRRGALNPRAGMAAAEAAAPKGQLLGGIKSVVSELASDPLAYSTGLGGVKAGLSLAGKLGVPVGDTNLTGKVALESTKAASKAYGLGSQGVGKVPTSFEVVAPAGAASFKPVTKDELKQLEAKGYDLAPRLRAKFEKQAAKNGWNAAEIDGISGSALIDKAFTKPAPLPLRVAANFAGGVAQLGTLPAGVEGAIRETAKGNGAKVGQALAEGLYSELPVVGKHSTKDTVVADPFGFISQFAGAGKTVGVAGKLGRAGEAAERAVTTASSGLKVERGALSKNAYTATGQLVADKAASQVPHFGRKLEAEVVDKAVRRTTNKHSPAFVKVQRAYKGDLEKVGHKRAAELAGFQMSGGKPEQLAAFYRAQGTADAAKFFDRVATKTKSLDAKDKAFLDTHAALAKHTGDTLIATGKFGDTAAKFRAYSPLIRAAAHQGDPDAQHILQLRDDYFNAAPLKAPEVSPAIKAKLSTVESQAVKHEAEYGRLERVANVKPKRPPKGSGADAQAAWRVENKKWQSKARTARAKMQVHRTQADRLNAKAEEIRSSIRSKEAEHELDPQAAAESVYAEAVDAFAAKHTANGGQEPVRVAYAQPKPLIASPFTPGPGASTGFKVGGAKQKAETGATFESGRYLIDPNSPLVESVRAQREHLAAVLHQEVSESVGQKLTAGAPIPPGHVFVSETNLRGLRRTTNDLADNPVSSPDYYAEEAGVRQKLYDHLSANTTPSGQRVPRGEKGYAIPEGAWKRILDHTRPSSRNAWDRFMKQYQRVLVSYRPSTIVNNTIGSLPLAMTGGAGPKSFKQAFDAMRDPTLAPAVLRGHGVAGSLAPGVRSKAGVGMDFMRAQSARGEDFSRLATYFAKAGPTFKKRADELEMSADDYQRALAAGEVDPKPLDGFLDHTEKFVGDAAKPDGALGRFASHGVLFHRWVGHIAKLILYTLPVKHPRRLAVLNSLADYGDQYRQENGVWPDWYAEYLPLFQSIKRVGPGDKPQVFTKTFSTQGVNPFSTLNNFANPVSTGDPVGDLLTGILAPPLQIGLKTAFQRPYDSHSAAKFALGQTLRQVPGVTVVRPQGGMAPDSIPFLAEERKTYSSGRKVNGKTVPLPWDMRPTAQAEPGILGALIRYGLGGVYDVPAQGPIHTRDQRKHIGAKAKEARKG